MRIGRTLTALAALVSLALTPGTAGKGIETADIDRSADPCTDFFQFANGAWRAANPIPPSMGRWSRRWQAGEANKDRLKGILEEAAAVKDAPKGSVDHLVSDVYSACRDQAGINSRGAGPIEPLFAAIDAMKNPADIRLVVTNLHSIAIRVPFAVFGNSDNHNPNDVIAQIFASGLAMPDRDYYL